MRRRCTSLLCTGLRRMCTSQRRICTSIRRLCASLSRQVTFYTACFCVIIGLTILTLKLTFQNTSVNQIRHMDVQPFRHDYNDTPAVNHMEKNNRSLAELPGDFPVNDAVPALDDFHGQEHNTMPKLNKYEDVMKLASQTKHHGNIFHVQSFTIKHGNSQHFLNPSDIFNSTVYVNHSNSIKQIKREVSELIQSYIYSTMRQEERQAPQNLRKFKYASHNILQVLLNTIPSSERSSLSQILLQILKDKNITNFQNHVNTTLLNEIIYKIMSYTMKASALYKDRHDLAFAPNNNTFNITNVHIRTVDEPINAKIPPHRRVPRIFIPKQLRYYTKESVNSSSLTGKELEIHDGIDRVVTGIYWSNDVENNIPKGSLCAVVCNIRILSYGFKRTIESIRQDLSVEEGVSDKAADEWIKRSRSMTFQLVEPASWNKCGRPKNAFAVRSDGSSVCVRYRSPNDRLLQGEVMSYWLARLLGLDNVPPVHLSSVGSRLWGKLEHQFTALGWTKGNLVATIMWIQQIDPRPDRKQVFMPSPVLKAYREKQPIDKSAFKFFKLTNSHKNEENVNNSLSSGTVPEYMNTAVSLAQWGSMIIFDYLTANYDRVASMQDGAYKENKSSIIEESIRNLRSSKQENKLWLIDNESGLFDAYDLMYRSQDSGQRFVQFHNDMLHTICIFQRRVVQQLQELHRQGRAHIALEKWAEKQEPLLKLIERDSSYELFKRHFSHRVGAVLKWIRYCETRAAER